MGELNFFKGGKFWESGSKVVFLGVRLRDVRKLVFLGLGWISGRGIVVIVFCSSFLVSILGIVIF